jgi:phospholipase/carboxylesterase
MHDLQGLRRLLPDDWTLVTPRATFAGRAWGYGPGWAWYRYINEDRVVPATLEQSLEVLDGFLDRLPQLVGGSVDRLVLGGFSQGGTMSLAYALTHDRPLAAVLNFSGFLADGIAVPGPESLPPIFWGHAGGEGPSHAGRSGDRSGDLRSSHRTRHRAGRGGRRPPGSRSAEVKRWCARSP